MKQLSFLIVCIICIGCGDGNKAPSNLLAKEKMQLVMWDLLEANSFTQRYMKMDTLKNPAIENLQMQQQIFQLHKINKDDFYRSYDYYSSHPDEMRILLDSIVAIGERNKIQMIELHNGGGKAVAPAR